MKAFSPEKTKRILVRSANWVGDTIMSTPVIRAIRKNFPEASVSILAKPWVAPVFDHNPHIDRMISYDAAGRHAGWSGKIRLSRDLRQERFDLAILIQNAFEAALLAYLAGIPGRLGYNTDARGFLLTHSVRLDPALKQGHQVDYYLGILKGASLELDGRELTLVVSEKERARAQTTLSRHGVKEGTRLIGINPGATYGNAKRWFPERYAALCNRLKGSFQANILIFGGSSEERLGQEVAEMIGKEAINLCGQTDLREAMALIEKCDLFVTNDSGLMHVAAAFDIPQVVVIGSTDHVATGPSNPRSQIVRVPVSCNPCLKPDCPTDHRCMNEITVDMVHVAAESVLAGKTTLS
jgi:heptosyltransferase-2